MRWKMSVAKGRRSGRGLAVGILTALSCLLAPVAAQADQSFNVAVSGTADIFGAGLTQVPALGSSGTTMNPGGGTLPPGVSFVASPGEYVRFPSVTGAVYCDSSMMPTATPNGPCGSFNPGGTSLDAVGPISGITDAQSNDFLTGVFVGAGPPSGSPPASLDFSSTAIGANYLTLAPLLDQVFFIGSGTTSAGALHAVTAPPGATRLFLGIADGSSFDGPPSDYDDNGGTYQASVDFVSPPVVAKTINSILPNLTCVDHRKFVIPVRQTRSGNGNVIAASIYVNHKLTKQVTGKNITSVKIVKLPIRGRYVVKVLTLTTKNFEITSTRTYKGCKKGQRSDIKHKR